MSKVIDATFLESVKQATQVAAGNSVARQLHDRIYGRDTLAEVMKQVKLALPGQELADAVSRAAAGYNIALRSLELGHLDRIQELAAVVRGELVPALGSYAELSKAITEALRPIRLPDNLAWNVSLASRLPTFDERWIRPGVDVATGLYDFGSLSRLSDAVHLADPYAPDVSELVDEELGETVIDPGNESASTEVNPNFFSFRNEDFPIVTYRAGFVFRLDSIGVPDLEDGSRFSGVFDPLHNALLTALEQGFRRIVVQDLQAFDGTDWMRKVPPAMLVKWKEKQDVDRGSGRAVFEIIQYADFMDFADIISMRGNWNNCFSARFRGKDDFVVSLRRLHPIRNAVAHSRPIGQADALVLVAEASRLFIQLGLPGVDIIT